MTQFEPEPDDCRALLARSPTVSYQQMPRLASGLSAAAWLLGALASARRRHLRLAEKLREQSRWIQRHTLTDAVTAVANRRRFMEALTAEVRRVRRYKRCLSLALIEIEGFRVINDEFGHEVGDAVLSAVAQCLTSTLRQTDFIGRVSGGGFGLLLPETARNQALVALRRVSAAVDDLNASGDLPVEVRLAVGITDLVAEPEQMLAVARDAAGRALEVGSAAVCQP